MAQRRFHYEQAFEHYLRSNELPYVAVDEARKALAGKATRSGLDALKSFDFVVYGPRHNQLIDVKGRKVRVGGKDRSRADCAARPSLRSGTNPLQIGRLETWVTQDDVDSLTEWERLFGDGFRAYFVFLYWCEAQPPDALFQEIFEFRERWYALRAVRLDRYVAHMQPRSAKWHTVSVPSRDFVAISEPVAHLYESSEGIDASSPSRLPRPEGSL